MNPGSVVFDGALWLAIPIAMLAGLVSFLSPCVLPLVPGYLGFLGGAVPTGSRSRATGARGRLLAGVLLFIAGFTVVFVAMGVLAGTLGRFFIQYGDLLTRVLGVVVIVMGLVFLGMFGFAQRTMKPQVRTGLGLVGAPLLGIAMGIALIGQHDKGAATTGEIVTIAIEAIGHGQSSVSPSSARLSARAGWIVDTACL